ncbi:hypothetical protein N7508_004212 [Penicillium antarcticum]|uniref:uncharacterized protein n=1 Tax=Penicillium antarcticum TaxID=416450 RepID=UPI002390DCC9|nr:uncharacterized protein N7508_004212 [Penicillium antarcticum]KAJ5308833.1 hypothetical protein N7508_004212 [Penicillium antarcticum]
MNRPFSFGKQDIAVANSSTARNMETRALPAQWYRSPALYSLERRAIFSKKWIFETRFLNAGDYVQYTVAVYNLLVFKYRKSTIRAFPTVCRHRAYPVMETECDTANIMACKYHSEFGTNTERGCANISRIVIVSIHIHVDKLGFIWVNLETPTKSTFSWEEDTSGDDQQPCLQHFNMSEYRFGHQWSMMGDYNWKTLADNYNECYHCPTGHPGVNAVSDLSSYHVEVKRGIIEHYNIKKEDTTGFDINGSFYFPNASIAISYVSYPLHMSIADWVSNRPIFFYMMRCIPVSESQTLMEYEAYRHKDAPEAKFTNLVISSNRSFAMRHRKTSTRASSPTDRYILLRRSKNGPLYFQKLVRDLALSIGWRKKRLVRKFGQQYLDISRHQKLMRYSNSVRGLAVY